MNDDILLLLQSIQSNVNKLLTERIVQLEDESKLQVLINENLIASAEALLQRIQVLENGLTFND
jgi:ABC-type branched-subunit amino acid transport system ATPase component